LFLAAQTIGGVVSSLILGPISQKRGSHLVMRATMILALIPPLIGLLLYSSRRTTRRWRQSERF